MASAVMGWRMARVVGAERERGGPLARMAGKGFSEKVILELGPY